MRFYKEQIEGNSQKISEKILFEKSRFDSGVSSFFKKFLNNSFSTLRFFNDMKKIIKKVIDEKLLSINMIFSRDFYFLDFKK